MIHDLSATSPDHAISIEPFLTSELKTIRGPKVLLHSPSTIGGLVNVVREEIPFGAIDEPLWMWGLDGASVSNSALTGGEFLVPVGNVNFRGEASYRNSSDIKSPNKKIENSAPRKFKSFLWFHLQ